MKNMIVFGATSAIAEATIRLYAAEGWNLFLVARNEAKLSSLAADLTIRYPHIAVHHQVSDLLDTSAHLSLLEKIYQTFPRIDVALIAYGVLPDQSQCEKSYAHTMQALQVNLLSVISLLTLIANYMQIAKQGSLVVISSVAGDRGRQSNYVYGTAKGGLTIFLQGLRNRLARSNVHVLTIKPGIINTPMTKHLKKGLLHAKTSSIAPRIKRAIDKKVNEIYVPGYWRYIMMVIKGIPESVFKRMSL
jgi:short-subunit dehydrogenase